MSGQCGGVAIEGCTCCACTHSRAKGKQWWARYEQQKKIVLAKCGEKQTRSVFLWKPLLCPKTGERHWFHRVTLHEVRTFTHQLYGYIAGMPAWEWTLTEIRKEKS